MKTIEERFWPKVSKRGPDDCWPWIGAKSKGYGILSSKRGQSPFKAYRISLELHGRPMPAGMEALHDCDNPSCVNPKHLRWATHKQNMADAYARGRISNYRHGCGEANNASKLTAKQVAEIRKATGTQSRIASIFGVSRRTIHNIKNNLKWREHGQLQ